MARRAQEIIRTSTFTLKKKLAIKVTGAIKVKSQFFSFTILCIMAINKSTIVAATPASIPFRMAEMIGLSLKALYELEISDKMRMGERIVRITLMIATQITAMR